MFQLSASNPQDERPFSFLSALQEGYFSDITITADSKKQVRLEFHSVLSMNVVLILLICKHWGMGYVLTVSVIFSFQSRKPY